MCLSLLCAKVCMYYKSVETVTFRHIFISNKVKPLLCNIASNMAARGKQTRLNLEQKVEILGKLDKGVKANRLALEYNVTDSAISQIKKKKSEILSAVSESLEEVSRKTIRKGEFPEIETKLFEWFLKQRERKCSVSRMMLKVKALEIFKQEFPDKEDNAFTASDGWITKFKMRHGMRFLKVCGEILSSDTTSITPFIHRFRKVISDMGLTNEQIYNADESGLYYRMLPEKTYVSAVEKSAPGRKIQKERLTFMLCANAEGTHKTKPLVIGKSKQPRVFKDFDNPLHYDNSKSAWMTSKIFSNWFHHQFVKEVHKFILHKVCHIYGMKCV